MDEGALRRTYKPFRARLLARAITPSSLGLKPRSKREVKVAKEEHLSKQEKWKEWKKEHDKDWAAYLRSQGAPQPLPKTNRPKTKR